MKSDYVVTLTANGLQPATTPAIELAEIITRLNEACRRQLDDDSQGDEEVPFSLVDVGEGSCRLTFAVATSYMVALASFTGAINSGDYTGLVREAHDALYRLSQQSERLGWGITLTENEEMSVQSAQISSDSPVPKPAVQTVVGTTTLYGTCLRVGGAKPRAEIRPIDQGKILFISVSEQLARSLGNRLYERVELQGEATWDSESRDLTDFSASGLGAYQRVDPIDAFRNLAVNAGDTWKGVDASSYVSELRSTQVDS